jgi:formylglycine-generating enzyme required for sulfatase activity
VRARVAAAGAGAGAAALVLAGACAPKRVDVGGVVVQMHLDGTLRVSDLSALAVEVDPPGDGPSYYERTFDIPRDLATFPASLAIESNGNPTASAWIRLTLRTPSGTVDARKYELVDIPVGETTIFDVTFSRECRPDAVQCGDGNCCVAPSGSAGCSGSVVRAQQELKCTVPDGGAPDATGDAPIDVPEASFDAGDATLAPDGQDSSVEAGEAGPTGNDGGTSCNPSCVGATQCVGGTCVALPPTACNPPCIEGTTHCVGNKCVAVPPSCAGGGPGAGFNCGGYGGSGDCCAALDVPLGTQKQETFYRDFDGMTFTDLSHPATVSQFSLDVYEVTVGRFRKFVSAVVGADGGVPWVPDAGSGVHTHLEGGLNAGGTAASNHETGWDPSWNSDLPTTKADWDNRLTSLSGCTTTGGPVFTWTPEPILDSQNPSEILPISCVDWFTAYAFCIWDGGFLPSLTEWDCAAAGGQSQRVYAWGDSPPDESSSYAIYNCLYHQSATGLCWNNYSSNKNVAAVGYAFKGQGLWGQMDLTGSVFEWTLDYYDNTYPLPCTDCANFSNGAQRTVRGGGFDSPLGILSVSEASYNSPSNAPGDNGIRCARPPY